MYGQESREPSQPRFHYDRAERLAGREVPEPRPKGVFRANRALLIVVLDLVLLLVIFLAYRFFLAGEPGVRRVEDFRLELSAFEFDGAVYLTLEVRRVRAGRPFEAAESLVRVRFAEGEWLTDVLPTVEGAAVAFRAVAEGPEAERILASGRATVQADLMGRTVELERPVSGGI